MRRALCHSFLPSGVNNQTRFFSQRAGLDALSASLPGCLAASYALGSARSGFEAPPVVDADHGESESRSRRRRGRCCGLWEKHKGNGVAPEGICAACRARSIRRSQLVG